SPVTTVRCCINAILDEKRRRSAVAPSITRIRGASLLPGGPPILPREVASLLFPRCIMAHLMALRRMLPKPSSMDAHAALPYLESYFDPKTFTFELDALGLKLTATRMVDGTIRINRWHMHEVWSNERRVN